MPNTRRKFNSEEKARIVLGRDMGTGLLSHFCLYIRYPIRLFPVPFSLRATGQN
ncbi:hypothetical protein J2S25_003848 [Mesobacillus stamsii]|uniref:Transposase n=1 Tax=Mesobacillus stamsii TaxID=225347 RepID=A0ABU0G0A7_9BACI|nr:hypothetical protein [Mesobacillus stamsii]